MDAVANADPSGFLPAALAAVRLVGAVAKVAPHVKNSVDNYRNAQTGAGPQGAPGVNRAVSNDPTAALSLQVDPERESRAYETVNYVLRTLGNRIGEAGLVSAPALAKALTAAATHIEVELFSVNAHRLFKSLASKLKDAVLVNSVFTSIYFIGAITAELSSSLPNYKSTYPPLGPFIIQQIFRAAIGEDAFKENITANLDAYKTLATTAGLLRPTDIGYSIFPGFPSLSPTRYSSKSYTEVRNHKNIFQGLIKHFDFHGFPQPKPGLDVGPIKDWRFLSGDANSRWFEVEKADKHIGEAIGRVLYWLICGADRMPGGMAVIAYYKQHIELIQWMGSRFGYRVLNGKQDLDLAGPHLRLENKYRATIEAWVIIMPSESASLNKKQSEAQWNSIRQYTPPTPISPSLSNASTSHERLSMSSSISSVDNTTLPPSKQSITATHRSIGIGSAIANVGKAARRTESYPKPSGVQAGAHSTLSSPGLVAHTETPGTVTSPNDTSNASTPVTYAATEFSTSASSPVSESFGSMDYGHPAANLTPQISHTSENPASFLGAALTPPLSHASPDLSTPPPSYFPPVPSQPSSNSMNPPQPAGNNRPPQRKRAPPPPRKFPLAKALYDFGPEEEGGEELLFHEGDELEIVEKSEELEADGWCKARVKGTTHVGLAPLEYLEEIKVVKKAPPPPGGAARARMAPGPASAAPMHTNVRSLSGGPGAAGPGVSRSLSSASVGGRPHGGMQPQLIGIHENPQFHQNFYQNPNGRPQSVSLQNPHGHPHSHIPVNPQMQHNLHAHPVHSTHPELASQQSSGSHHPSTSNPAHEPQDTANTQARGIQQPNVQRTSSNASSTLGRDASQSNDRKINTPSKQPAGTQQPGAAHAKPAAAQGQKPRPGTAQSNRPNGGQGPNAQPATHQNIMLAANLLQMAAGSGGGQQQGTRPNRMQNQNQNQNMNQNQNQSQNTSSYNNANDPHPDHNAEYQHHSSAGNPNYNPNTQSTEYYGTTYPNAGYGQPTYVADPATISSGPRYYDSGYSGEDLALAGMAGQEAETTLADEPNPSSFMSSVSDLASIDPFYAQMNPAFAADTPTTDATGGDDASDDGVDESTNALAGLGFEASVTVSIGSTDSSAATNGLDPGSNFMESPLAGLAPPEHGSSAYQSAGGDTSALDAGVGYDAGVSPLAGLASPENTGDTSAADLGAGVDQISEYDAAVQAASESAAIQAGADDNAYDSISGSTTTYVEEETTTTSSSFWTSMCDDDDDGFGYS